jgi:hypothetical protein
MSDHRSPLAKARDEWLDSPEGKRCSNADLLRYPCQRQFLENRLIEAFCAGANWEVVYLAEHSPETPQEMNNLWDTETTPST